MTRIGESVPLKGGPSDGAMFKSVTRWPTYLHGDGTKMIPALGDRIVNNRSRTRGCYVIQRDFASMDITGYKWIDMDGA